MSDAKNKISIYKQLEPYFEEIKELILMNSSSSIANIVNEKYDISVTRSDIDNFLYNHQKGFDVVEYRKEHQKFNFQKAREEDSKKQHLPRLP